MSEKQLGLLEASISKQDAVSQASIAKKLALSPESILPQEISLYDPDTLTVGDTSFRLDDPRPGYSYNAPERDTGKPLTPKQRKRTDFQKKDKGQSTDIPPWLIADQAVFNAEESSRNNLQEAIDRLPSTKLNIFGKDKTYGRPLADLTTEDGQSIIAPKNTPEENWNYNSKRNYLQKFDDQIELARAKRTRQENALFDTDTTLGSIGNIFMGGVSGVANVVGNIAATPFEIGGYFNEQGLTDQDRILSGSIREKAQIASKDDTYDFEGNLSPEEVRHLTGYEDGGISRFDKVKISENLKQSVQHITDFEKSISDLVDSGDKDAAFQKGKDYYNLTIKANWEQAGKNFEKGNNVDGIADLARAIQGIGFGLFNTITEHPEGIATVLTESLPHMALASKKIFTAFISTFVDKSASARDGFVKEYGRLPEGQEVYTLLASEAVATALDIGGDRYVFGDHKGLFKSASAELGAESLTSGFEQYGAKQDINKVDQAEMFASGVLGFGSGGLTNVGLNPIDTLKGALGVGGKAVSAITPPKIKAAAAKKAGTLKQQAKDRADLAAGDVSKIQDKSPLLAETIKINHLLKQEDVTEEVFTESMIAIETEIALAETFIAENKEDPATASQVAILEQEIVEAKRTRANAIEESKVDQQFQDDVTAKSKVKVEAGLVKVRKGTATTEDIIEIFGSSNSESLKDMKEEDFEAVEKLDLTSEQRIKINRFKNIRRIGATVKSVNNDVMFGTGKIQKDGRFFVGGETYLSSIVSGLKDGNTRKVGVAVGGLKNFYSVHNTKLTNLTEALKILNQETIDESRLEELSNITGGLTLNSPQGVQTLITAVGAEVAYLEGAVEESTRLLNKPAKEVKTPENASVIVEEEQDSISVPSENFIAERATKALKGTNINPEGLISNLKKHAKKYGDKFSTENLTKILKEVTEGLDGKGNKSSKGYQIAQILLKKSTSKPVIVDSKIVGKIILTALKIKQVTTEASQIIIDKATTAIKKSNPKTVEESNNRIQNLLDGINLNSESKGKDSEAYKLGAELIESYGHQKLVSNSPISEKVVRSFKTSKDVVEYIMALSDDPILRSIAKKVLPIIGEGTEIIVKEHEKGDPKGKYTIDENGKKSITIFLGKGNEIKGQNLNTILHEIVHEATIAILNKANPTKEEAKAIKELDTVRAEISAYVSADTSISGKAKETLLRGLDSREEFITYSLFNQTFQGYLSNIPTKPKELSYVDKIVNIFKDLLNLNEDTNNFLLDAITASVNVIDVTAKGSLDNQKINLAEEILYTGEGDVHVGTPYLNSSEHFEAKPNTSKLSVFSRIRDVFSGTHEDITSKLKDQDDKDLFQLIKEFRNKLKEDFTGDNKPSKKVFSKKAIEAIEGGKVNSNNYLSFFYKEVEEGVYTLDDSVIDIISVAGFNWLATEGKQTLTENTTDVAAILGVVPSRELSDLIKGKGVPRSTVVDSLGSAIYKELGIKVKDTKDRKVEGILKTNLGAVALARMINTGYLVPHELSAKALNNSPLLEGVEASGDIINFVVIANTSEVTDGKLRLIPTPEITKIIDDLGINKNFLDTVFDTVSTRKAPTSAPTKGEQEYVSDLEDAKLGGDVELIAKSDKALAAYYEREGVLKKHIIQKADSTSKKAIQTQNHNAFKIDHPVYNNITHLGKDAVMALRGFRKDTRGVSAMNLASVEGKNRSIEDEYDTLDQFILDQEDSNSEHYLSHTIWNNMRRGEDGSMSAQASHYTRAVSKMAESFSETTGNNIHFQMGVLAALPYKGFDVEISSAKEIRVAFQELIKDQRIIDLLADMKRTKEDGALKFPFPKEAFISLVEEFGTAIQAIDGITALEAYTEANGKPFTSSIMNEFDGKTHGPVTAAWMFGDMALAKLGGFLTGEKSIKEIMNADGYTDLYQTFGNAWAKFLTVAKRDIKDLTIDKIALLEGLVGAIVDSEGNILPNARTISKPVVTKSVYAAGPNSLINDLVYGTPKAEGIVDKVIQRIEDAYATGGQYENLNKFLRKLTNDPSIELTHDNVLEFQLSRIHLSEITEDVSKLYKAPLEKALKEVFGKVLKHSNDVIAMTNVIFKGYEAVIQANIDKLVEEKVTITEEVFKKILTDNIHFAPSFAHAGTDKNDASTEWFGAKIKPTTNYKSSHTSSNNFIGTVKTSKGTAASLYTHGKELALHSPGAKALAMLTIGSDGAITAKIHADIAGILNLHDATEVGISNSPNMANIMNDKFSEVINDYSIRGAIQDRVDTIRATLKDGKAPFSREFKNAFAKALKVSDDNELSKFPNGAIFSKGKVDKVEAIYLTPESYLNEFGSNSDKLEKELVQNRKDLTGIDNFIGLDSPHYLNGFVPKDVEVTEDNIQEIQAEIVKEVVTPKVDRSAISDKQEIDIYRVFSEVGSYKDGTRLTQQKATDTLNEQLDLNKTKGQYKRIFDAFDSSQFDNNFGSTAEDIDVDNFVATYESVVNKETSEEIFNELAKVDTNGEPKYGNKPESLSHIAKLKQEMITVINPVLTQVSLHMQNTEEATRGEIHGDTDVYIENSKGTLLGALGMSTVETYMHELFHGITTAALRLPENALFTEKLEKLYSHVQQNITLEQFIPVDADNATRVQAENRYKYFLDPSTRSENYLEEFIAFGKTNEHFISLLQAAVPNRKERFIDLSNGYLAAIQNLFIKLVDTLMDTLGNKPKSAKNELDILVKRVAHAQLKQKNLLFKTVDLLPIDNALQEKINNWVLAPIHKLAQSGLLINSSISGVSATGTALRNTSDAIKAVKVLQEAEPDKSFEELSEGKFTSPGDIITKTFSEVARRIGVSDRGLLRNIVWTVTTSSTPVRAFERLLRHAAMNVDKVRKEVSGALHKQLIGKYEGTLTGKESTAIYRVINKIELFALSDSHSNTKILKLLKDPALVATEIANIRTKLNAYGKDAFFYNTYAKSLGKFMVTGEFLGDISNPLLNASAIAHKATTSYQVSGGVEAQTKLIDELATLYGIQFSSKKDVDALVGVWDRENLRASKGISDHGVDVTMSKAKNLKRDSLKTVFGGSPARAIKGYTSEVTNPDIAMKIGTKAEEKEMNRNGFFIQGEELKGDKDHSLSKPNYMYVNNTAKLAQHNSGIVSYTSEKAKGLGSAFEYGSHGLSRLAKIKQKRADKAFTNTSPITSTKNNLVPILDDGYNVTGYRYMMKESTKRDTLQLKESFSQSMGILQSRILDPENTSKVNAGAVKALKSDWDDYGKKIPKEFSIIGPNVADPSLREIYAKMPKEMREQLIKEFGSKNFRVRSQVLVTVFGQREFSLATAIFQGAEGAKLNRTVLNQFSKFLVDKLGITKIRQGENLHQELIAKAKDTIVIKSIEVFYDNVVSNNWLLSLKGLSVGEIARDSAIGWSSVKNYLADSETLSDLKFDLSIASTTKAVNLTKKIKVIKRRMAKNVMHDLINEGFLSSIVEDVDTFEDEFGYKSKLDAILSEYTKKVPKGLKDAGNIAVLAHDTEGYKIAKELTQLSDLVARYALHAHNLRKGVAVEDSYNEIADTFVNYEIQDHQAIEYLNKMGLIMFSKYFMRMQKVMLGTMKAAPTRMLAMLSINNFLQAASPVDAFLGDPTNRISNPLTVPGSIVTAQPLYNIL